MGREGARHAESQADGELTRSVRHTVNYFGLGSKIHQRIADNNLLTRAPMAAGNEAGSVLADVRENHRLVVRRLIGCFKIRYCIGGYPRLRSPSLHRIHDAAAVDSPKAGRLAPPARVDVSELAAVRSLDT